MDGFVDNLMALACFFWIYHSISTWQYYVNTQGSETFPELIGSRSISFFQWHIRKLWHLLSLTSSWTIVDCPIVPSQNFFIIIDQSMTRGCSVLGWIWQKNTFKDHCSAKQPGGVSDIWQNDQIPCVNDEICSKTSNNAIMDNISQCNSKTNSSVCVHVHPGYLEWVETGDDTAVLHVAGARGVSELAFGVRTRAGSSLELSAHLQRQPLGVATHGHIDGHGGPSVSGGLGWGSQMWWSTKAAKNEHSGKEILRLPV